MFKHPIAVVVSIISVLFFLLTQIANLVAIAHLPTDLREALIAMSHVPTLLAWAILGIGIVIAIYLAVQHFKKPKERSARYFAAETASPHQQFALALNVHNIWVQMPHLADSVIHINIDVFNGNAEDIYLKGINGQINVSRMDKNDSQTKLGKLTTPSFFETRRNHIPAHDEFSFTLTQSVPKKLAEALSNWDKEIKYEFDFEDLNIIVQSTNDSKKLARLPLWHAAALTQLDGRIVTGKIIRMRPGNQLKGLSQFRAIETPSDLAQRRASLIRDAREFVITATAKDGIDTDFKEKLETFLPFFELRPHFSESYLTKLNAQRTVYVPRDGTRLPALASGFLDEIDRLEKEWGLQ